MTMQTTLILDKIVRLPITLIIIISIVSISGFATLYSAAEGNVSPWAYKQMINFCLFMPVAIIIAITDIKLIFRFAYILYCIILLMLIGVELFGSVAMGAKRWIDLGFSKLQPSEPAKLAIVLMLARYFHELSDSDIGKIRSLLIPICATIVPVIFIVKQPDLGTGIITLIVAAVIFFAAGVKLWKFIVVGVGVICSFPAVWYLMHDYQRQRVLMFFAPEKDPLGAGYNIIQSKIAIGSGSIVGKGFLHGTQSHLNFLPEHQTDFIFAAFAEEWGFIGDILLLTMYAIIIIICVIISANTKNIFGKLLAIGATAIFFSHIFINIAMVMGMLPVVGVPLPLLSYGGTMMASILIGFGFIMNAQVHRHAHF